MATTVTIDPRIQAGAYIRRGDTLWQVLGVERDEDDCVTGKYTLENVHGEYGSGTWIYRRIAHTATELANHFVLVKHAPIIDHLDRQMDEHVRKAEADHGFGTNGFGMNGPISTQTGLPKPSRLSPGS